MSSVNWKSVITHTKEIKECNEKGYNVTVKTIDLKGNVTFYVGIPKLVDNEETGYTFIVDNQFTSHYISLIYNKEVLYINLAEIL